jgi:hypothetical protein
MSRIFFPSKGVEEWRHLLADPELHWKAGRSAMTLARCWEAANGLPSEIAALLTNIGSPAELLLAIPEHKVPLPGSSRGDSQNDIFALVRAGSTTVAVMIEGKVDEPFDRPLGQWLLNASDGKRERLAFVCEMLGLREPPPGDVFYQLLHRTASAVIEARRFGTSAACMIVHSFSPTGMWFDAFKRFVSLYNVEIERDRLVRLPGSTPVPLFVGWATGDAQYLK